jgi:hypothetical protein
MEAAGIDVWFDRQELGAGDRWKELIRRNIEDSSCFVAVLSRHCLTSQRREFRSEWSVAVNEQNKARGDLPFIVPVVIDDVPIEDPGLDAFRLMHQDRAPNGRPSPALLDKVQGLVRTHHLSRGGQG